MSVFCTNFSKILVLAVGVFCNVNYASCSTLLSENNHSRCWTPAETSKELLRGRDIAEFSWSQSHRQHTNTTILDHNQGNIVATIFTLRYKPASGETIGVYFNLTDGTRLTPSPALFYDTLNAKEWIINKAKAYGINLARS